MLVTVRYFAGARAAAGVAEEAVGATGTLGDLVADLAARHGPGLAKVLVAASFLVDGAPWHDRSVPLPDGDGDGVTIDVLPPFAGG